MTLIAHHNINMRDGTNGQTKPTSKEPAAAGRARTRSGYGSALVLWRTSADRGLKAQAVTEYFGSLAAIFHALTKPLAYTARRTVAPATTARIVPWPYTINSPVLGSSGIVPAAMINRTGPIISTAASAR